MHFKSETEQQVFDIAYSCLDEMEKQFIGAFVWKCLIERIDLVSACLCDNNV